LAIVCYIIIIITNRGQMKITEKHLQHMVHFLTHKANYKVKQFDEDIDFNINTTSELIDNAKCLIDSFYAGDLTYAKAMECVTHYRYDDDCINEGIGEMWWEYCNDNNLLDFYFNDENAWDYGERLRAKFN